MSVAFAAPISALTAAAWLATMAVPSRAAPSVVSVIDGTAHQALFAVAFDGEHGAAVGAAGQILLSRDGGKDWLPAKDSGASSLSLLGVDLKGDEHIAVGQAGLVLVSAGGESWQQAPAVTPERLFAVSMNGQGKAVAVGAFGTMIESVDHGRSWLAIPPPDVTKFTDEGADPHWYAVAVQQGGRVTVVGEFGLIVQTLDDGAHWTVAHRGAASLFALDLHADGKGFAVGQSGTILRTSDGGASWTDDLSHSEANLLAVSSGSGAKVFVTAMNSVLMSEDDGASWQAVAWGDFGSSWYAGVRFVEPQQTAVLVGHAGRILRMKP